MKIDVTQEDIDCGKQRSTSCCPVALAIRRTKPRFAPIIVERTCVVIGRYEYDLPPTAREFIADFDSTKDPDEEWPEPEPFSFELPVEG